MKIDKNICMALLAFPVLNIIIQLDQIQICSGFSIGFYIWSKLHDKGLVKDSSRIPRGFPRGWCACCCRATAHTPTHKGAAEPKTGSFPSGRARPGQVQLKHDSKNMPIRTWTLVLFGIVWHKNMYPVCSCDIIIWNST